MNEKRYISFLFMSTCLAKVYSRVSMLPFLSARKNLKIEP